MGHVWEPLNWKKMRAHGAQKGEEGWRGGVHQVKHLVSLLRAGHGGL